MTNIERKLNRTNRWRKEVDFRGILRPSFDFEIVERDKKQTLPILNMNIFFSVSLDERRNIPVTEFTFEKQHACQLRRK